MYNLVTAVVLAKDKPTGLIETDVSSMSLKDLLGNYNGYLVLTNNYLAGELFLLLKTMRETNLDISDYEGTTVSAWLKINGENVLPHIMDEPEFDINKVNYTDLHQGGFSRLAVHPYSTIEGYPVSSLTSLYVHKDIVDGDILAANSVAVINGYLHSSVQYKEGIKVADGCRTMMHSGIAQAGILSFNDVGGVRQETIKVDMISKMDQNLSYYQEAVIHLGVDLTGCKLLFSMAGQLVTSSKVYKVVDAENGVIVVNLANLNFIDRIQSALGFIEFDDMLNYTEEDNINQVSLETMLSDPFILSVLRMSQTFFMIMSTDFVTINREPVSYQGVYGRYFSHEYHYDPMIDELGRIVPYFYGGNEPYPWMVDKHVYNIPVEFVEKKQNIRNRHKWRYLGKTFDESVTNHTMASSLEWLKIGTITA